MDPADLDSQPDAEAGRKLPGCMADVVQWERRSHQRFAAVAEPQYTAAGTRGRATTLDVSSGGVFLKTETRLLVGKRIEVQIDWPVLLHERGALQLVMRGHVLRSAARGTAVRLVRYDFRVRAGCSPTRPA